MEHAVRCDTLVLVKEQMWLIYGELSHTKTQWKDINHCLLSTFSLI